jgi:hypothetical protein
MEANNKRKCEDETTLEVAPAEEVPEAKKQKTEEEEEEVPAPAEEDTASAEGEALTLCKECQEAEEEDLPPLEPIPTKEEEAATTEA